MEQQDVGSSPSSSLCSMSQASIRKLSAGREFRRVGEHWGILQGTAGPEFFKEM